MTVIMVVSSRSLFVGWVIVKIPNIHRSLKPQAQEVDCSELRRQGDSGDAAFQMGAAIGIGLIARIYKELKDRTPQKIQSINGQMH